MANLSNGKSVNNSHLKKRHNMMNSNTMGPDESNEVLDLRKSNPDKLCFWCGKRGSLSESGVESDFCSEVCFDQFRRDSFKKRSSCMWCNNSNHGVFNMSLMTNLDETKFCSDYCLTQFKVRLFCEETSAHLDKLKDGSVTVMNGQPSTATTIAKPSSKSPISMTSPVGTVGLTDLITPDLWLKKAQNKRSPPCTITSPFHGLSPRQNSTSPPLVSPSPSSDLETLPINDPLMNLKGGASGMGSIVMNRLQGIPALPLSNCPGKMPSVISTSGGNGIGKTKGPILGNDTLCGDNLRKRSKLTPQQSPKDFSNWNSVAQVSKGPSSKTSHLKGGKGNKKGISEHKISEHKTGMRQESPLSLCGGIKGVKPPLNINNGLPFQNSSSRLPGKPSQMIPYPQNIFMANGHANKINFGNLGLALSGGFGLGAFPSNFLPVDDNSTGSSSSCSTTSQVMDTTKRGPPLQQRKNFMTNFRQQNKESQTEFDFQSQTHEAGPENINLSSSTSILPPVTVLVPFPVAVPIPIPIPIPVILGSGFTMTEKNFNAFRGSSDALSNSSTTGETSTSQVRIECNNTSNKRDVSSENDTDDSQINSNSTPKTGENKEGKNPAVCGLVKVEDSLSATR